MYVRSRGLSVADFCLKSSRPRERQNFLLHAIGSRSDPVLRKDEIADVKVRYTTKQFAVVATAGSKAAAIPVETHLNGMSSICTVRSADAHSVPSAKATRRGRSIRKVAAVPRGRETMEEAYGAPFPIISRSAAALLLNFDRAFGKVPDLHCFNRCTVAARTLARLLRRCYPTRDCCRCYVASRIPQDTRSP